MLFIAAMTASPGNAQATTAQDVRLAQRSNLPPRVVQAERFLAQRGWTQGRAIGCHRAKTAAIMPQIETQSQSQGIAPWLPLGPAAVQSQNFGLVTGRVSALALDPSDATGNTLYAGTTGGGVWRSQNADTSNSANIAFTPLTDDLPALSGATDASISIGALSVQPGGTGVILAGTGDPNDALDSYYGAGILRSADGGITWSLISSTPSQTYSFAGEGFAGFAWSTVNQQRVVAAVSQAYEGTLVNAAGSGTSYEGLYYSSDSGATWALATITDGAGEDVQGPSDHFVLPDGNAATSVVWNPVRQLFVAAVRYHGYYQSADGITFTRMAAQPGLYLAASAGYCPTNSGSTGSSACPIFRGTLAVNPQTGDTFAWTVDIDNQDQGLWQDLCAVIAGGCGNPTITFAQQWQTAALETNDPLLGPATIENGDYNLALAAVPAGPIPSGQETMVLAGANDLWQANCPPSPGCQWRNTTNAATCMSAQVGEYQHALAWNASNPLEIFLGNDSGLWRSEDGIDESSVANPEPACSPTDASHFQNLNGSLGSLAEVVSLSQAGATPYTMMAGLGANGTGGVKSTTGTTADWPEILGGEGGPVVIDPAASTNWYVNNQPGVSIYRCSQLTACTPAAFGASPVISDADVGGDGLTMTSPAPFLVDPFDRTQLLIGTCRVWRGPADGVGWSSANAISPIGILGSSAGASCNGESLIRAITAMALPVSAALPNGGEVIYVGMYGSVDGGATLPGHVLSAIFNPSSSTPPVWTDLTPASSNTVALNYYGLDISSLFIDPHDPTGMTVYATVAGIPSPSEEVQTVYGSTNGGALWTDLMSNLPLAPANSLVVDPLDANTVYVATDAGVYSTRQITACTTASNDCWSAFGSGLPDAPVVQVSAAPASATVPDLVAATYGRGIWMAPLWTATGIGTGPATDILSPTSLTFPGTAIGQLSAAQTVTLTNSGGELLTSIAVTVSGAFQETNQCHGTLPANSSCAISVVYAASQAGSQTGTLSVSDALRTQTVALTGTGLQAPAFAVTPPSLAFTGQTVGLASLPQTLMVSNTGEAPLANVGFQFSGLSASSFATGITTCGATLTNGGSCTVQVVFTPATASVSAAALVISSSTFGVTPAILPLNGNGAVTTEFGASPSKLIFPVVLIGQSGTAQTVTVTNTGSFTATALALAVAAPFSLTQDTCTGHNLAASANCTVGVIFTPTVSGKAIGTLTVVSASVIIPPTVPLSGTGAVPFDFTVTGSGASSVAIANGQTAYYTLSLCGKEGCSSSAPGLGSQGAFTFQCGSLPAYSACTFNPSSESVSAGVTGNVVVEIATGLTQTSARAEYPPARPSVRPFAWPVLPLACGVVLLPFALRRRKALLLALLAILLGGFSGCTESGIGLSGPPPKSGPGITPAGTYSILVTASSSGVQHQVTLTLTVD